jgi:hypothetical protein
MLKKIKKTTKLLLHILGFDLTRFTPGNNPFLQLKKGIETFNIDLVLNIGANTGQFVSELRLIGYKNRGELSLVPLYEGGKLWLEMIKRLNSEGFTLWAIQKGFTDRYTRWSYS